MKKISFFSVVFLVSVLFCFGLQVSAAQNVTPDGIKYAIDETAKTVDITGFEGGGVR